MEQGEEGRTLLHPDPISACSNLPLLPRETLSLSGLPAPPLSLTPTLSPLG